MTSKPLDYRFDYWDAYVGGKKSKQTDLKDTPEQMSLPINDLPSILEFQTLSKV